MSFILIITLLVPAPSGAPFELELGRELVAGSMTVCVAHAVTRIEEAKVQHAAAIERMRGRVRGVCQPQGDAA